jgi:hypothetical protein
LRPRISMPIKLTSLLESSARNQMNGTIRDYNLPAH